MSCYSSGPGKDELDSNIRNALKTRSGFLNICGVLGPTAKFVSDVQPGGPQDYKLQQKGWAPFGNFNYGAVGAAYGYSEGKLLAAASGVQSYDNLRKNGQLTFGNNTDDPPVISAGVQYFRNGCYK